MSEPCKILLTYDVPDWAFHNECLDLMWFLQRFAPGEFTPTVARSREAPDPAGFDVVYSSFYFDLRCADHPRSVSQLASHSLWARPEDAWPAALLRWKWLVTKNLGIHERLDGYHPRVRQLGQQVNPGKWPTAMFHTSAKKMRVGFAGHAKQGSKGFDLIQEAVDLSGCCTMGAATYEQEGRISPENMPYFYHALDAYVCMSKQEGGPRPSLEAMLCGIPLITTRVGQVGEMVEDGVHALVVERNVDALVDALLLLKADPVLGQRLSWNARQLAYARVMRDGQAWVDFFREVRDS